MPRGHLQQPFTAAAKPLLSRIGVTPVAQSCSRMRVTIWWGSVMGWRRAAYAWEHRIGVGGGANMKRRNNAGKPTMAPIWRSGGDRHDDNGMLRTNYAAVVWAGTARLERHQCLCCHRVSDHRTTLYTLERRAVRDM